MNNDGGLTRAMGTEEAVEDAIQNDAELSTYAITVAVDGTSVSLSGEVGSEAAKRRAEQVALGVKGVLEVTNELVVVQRDDNDWPFAGGRRRDSNGAASGVDGTLGVAAVGAVNGGLGSAAGGAGINSGSPMGAAGLGVIAAADTEAAADMDDNGGRQRREDGGL